MKEIDKCDYCGRVFGQPDKDGFMVHQFDRSFVCTACQLFDSRESSRGQDYLDTRAINGQRRLG